VIRACACSLAGRCLLAGCCGPLQQRTTASTAVQQHNAARHLSTKRHQPSSAAAALACAFCCQRAQRRQKGHQGARVPGCQDAIQSGSQSGSQPSAPHLKPSTMTCLSMVSRYSAAAPSSPSSSSPLSAPPAAVLRRRPPLRLALAGVLPARVAEGSAVSTASAACMHLRPGHVLRVPWRG
jgi:hypothetical protein